MLPLSLLVRLSPASFVRWKATAFLWNWHPTLPGLAEPCEDAVAGQCASVYIKAILPEKMKVKLILIDTFAQTDPPQPPRYFVPESQTHLDYWRYTRIFSPHIETDFRFPNSI